ncbi:MAG: hypothetical protein N2248_02755 [candidate division WOR-3 bacterium]|uniref:Uncharacterized protein n=1 Tax=candidate division WOR-3 bacterium TaxID=2052148 RepID=A0A7C1SQ73_UNCW3|nr:hypothetical protein [candidate division WOR-3 bacterium]
MDWRKTVALILSGLLLAPPVQAAGDGGAGIIDEGGGEFRIEVPVTIPQDTVRQGQPRIPADRSGLFEESGAGIGYLVVQPDAVPDSIFLDGRRVLIDRQDKLLAVQQGRHYLSLFDVRDVYLAFRDETPSVFWQRIAPGLQVDRYALMSSYEREAVRTGTKWVSVLPEDTIAVRLSRQEVAQTYRRHAGTAALTFFSVTAVIAAAMIGSVMFITMDGE